MKKLRKNNTKTARWSTKGGEFNTSFTTKVWIVQFKVIRNWRVMGVTDNLHMISRTYVDVKVKTENFSII